MKIGVLALQGGFAPHAAMVETLGHRATEIRSAIDIDGMEGLILPGGESTTQLHLLDRDPALKRALIDRVESGIPVLATCAGLILAARAVFPSQACFGWIDIAVRRNAYGRQLDSFSGVADDGKTAVLMIRAPRIEELGRGVEVLATLNGEAILVRQGNRYGASFHPELGGDDSIHRMVFA
jgi:pyridoxal 5'-phosphate synthase pdxT subunit